MLRVTDDGKHAVLTGPLNAKVFEVARDMPGRKRWRGRELVFEPTRANVAYVREHLPEATWDSRRADEVVALETLEADTRAAKTLPPEASAFRFKTEPRAHQHTAFALSKSREAFALFLEQGLGKTKIILDTAAHLWAEGRIDCLLVTAPNGVHAQWVTEQVPKHLPDWANRECLVYRSAQGKRWLAEAERVLASEDCLKIIAVHIDAFSTKKGTAFAERVLSSNRCLWALDESVSIKTPGAARTKAVLRLSKLAPYRRILTGTPITKGVEDLYSQCRFLSDDVLGFSSFYTFRNRYCITQPVPGAPHGAVKIVGYQNQEELKDRLDGWSLRLRSADCLDLPERTYQTRHVELTPEQERLYRDLKNDLLAQLDGGQIVTADQAAVRLLRLQQVLCGHLRTEDGDLAEVKSNRVAAALAAADEVDGKVVIWARFRYDIDALAEAFKHYRPAVWDGRTSADERAAGKARFINDPECRAFIANPSAAGTGVDGLQLAARTMIYYSNGFKAVDRWQSEARLFRDGQTGTVNVIDLVAPKTVDGHILKTLRNREDVARTTLDVRDAI